MDKRYINYCGADIAMNGMRLNDGSPVQWRMAAPMSVVIENYDSIDDSDRRVMESRLKMKGWIEVDG